MRGIFAAVFFAAATIAAVGSTVKYLQRLKKNNPSRKNRRKAQPILEDGALDLVGNTPMIRLPALSALLNTTVLGKCEFMNLGGSSKDRVALSIIENAERSGKLRQNPSSPMTIYEGTVGSTGISLSWIARLKGYRCHICMPDDQAGEKYALLEKLGAHIERLKPCAISNAGHFCRVAERRAREDPNGLLANQFENLDNILVHYETTGPEMFESTNGQMDYLILGAGTGGTIAGCSRFLKPLIPRLRVILADPQGSGLFNKVKHGVMYSNEEQEGRRKRHQVDTIVEGVGINRMTNNLNTVLGTGRNLENFGESLNAIVSRDAASGIDEESALTWIDDAIRVTDEEAVAMARWMMKYEGLFLGSSSCVNLVAVVKLSRRRNVKGKTVVTMLCDAGYRHMTKFWSDDYLKQEGIAIMDETDPRFAKLEFIQ